MFTLATGDDYRSANVTKSFVSNLNGLAVIVIFAAQGAIVWLQTLAWMAGTIAGGFAGAHLARIIPRRVVQVLIVTVGAALTIAFAYR